MWVVDKVAARRAALAPMRSFISRSIHKQTSWLPDVECCISPLKKCSAIKQENLELFNHLVSTIELEPEPPCSVHFEAMLSVFASALHTFLAPCHSIRW
jgi:hypothetical protein